MSALAKVLCAVRKACALAMAYALVAFVMCVLSGAREGATAALWAWTMPMLLATAIDTFAPRAAPARRTSCPAG